MRPAIYLAGSIAGLTLEGASTWRDDMVRRDFENRFRFLTPLRGKDSVFDPKDTITNVPYDHHTLTTAKAVTRRDLWDVTRADAVFANLLGATRVSIGTVMEISAAYQANVPLILVMEEGNVHEHLMLNEAAWYRVDTLEDGVKILEWLFEER